MEDGKFSRYEIRSVLGKGGMSEVYRAYDPDFGREVALKILRPEMIADVRVRERFERETKIIARLELEGVVPVYDLGRSDNGQLFFVMRLMTGGTLSERIQDGPLSPAEIIRIIQRIVPALDEAHRRGIIHRDLKPSNILFDERDNAFISDFGIAKSINISARITLTDGEGIVGTPRYMSPEQARGDLVDSRSDIYSLGVIVLEMLVGKTYFDTFTPMGLAFRDENGPIPNLLDTNPTLPAGVQKVMEKILARDRNLRYATATDFANALAAALSEPVMPPSPIRPRRQLRSPSWRIAGFIILVLVISFALWGYPQFFPPTTPASPTLTSKPSETPVPTDTPTPTMTFTPTVEPTATLTSTVTATATATQTGAPIGTTPYLVLNVFVTMIFFGLLGLLVYATGNVSFSRRGAVTKQKPVIQASAKPSLPASSETTTMTTNLFAVVDPTKRKELLVLFGRELEMRITDKIADFGGGRYLLHGFGGFGATTLINQIVRKAELEFALKNKIQSKGFIMTVHIDAASLEEKDEQIHAVIKELKYEAIHGHYAHSFINRVEQLDKRDQNHSAGGNTFTDEKTVSIKATVPGFETQYSRTLGNERSSPKITGDELLKLVRNFLDRAEQENPHSLELLIDKVLGTTTIPARIIFVIDHIKSASVFQLIRRMRLFDEDRITFFAVVKQEQYLPWSQNEGILNMLKELKFQLQYLPCLWEEKTNFVRALIMEAFGPNIVGAQALLPDFIDHIAFVSRGAPADAANETVKTDYCESHSGKLILNLEKIPDVEYMKANANLQRILARNWDAILLPRFKAAKAEEADQARLAIYKLMDWMNSQKRFSFSTARKFALRSRLRILKDRQMTENILNTVLDILVREHYLMFNEGIYGVAHLTTPEDLLRKHPENNRKKRTNFSKQINRSQRSNSHSSRRPI